MHTVLKMGGGWIWFFSPMVDNASMLRTCAVARRPRLFRLRKRGSVEAWKRGSVEALKRSNTPLLERSERAPALKDRSAEGEIYWVMNDCVSPKCY